MKKAGLFLFLFFICLSSANSQVEADSANIFNINLKPDTLPDSSAYMALLKNLLAPQDSGMSDTGLEIDNLILNETITKTGKDFYDIFYKNWLQPDNVNSTTIIVEEKPLPSMGSRISIKVNEYYVFQKVLQPRYDMISDAALACIGTVTNFLINYRQIQQNLEGEDLHGSGIY